MNRTELNACIAEQAALRYTPAGLPALDLILEHASEVEEAGQMRKVQLKLRALAIGSLAERLAKQAVGSVWTFKGFLATPRQGKSVVLHIQEFQQD
ncbi:primosomal replication protein N [Limnohabitans planktonicus]|uniref:Replication restart protein PriB n=1 Tax=Limnohabitans planktonicus II-D5 TaxID=1293045 RepID=A0A2T7UH29_9BURK|nr:primosomal replication protein N [Limnohabitans planktonicus]PVE43999.1 primosomal replication protein N [Limnohabitans planktonicus II-D5]